MPAQLKRRVWLDLPRWHALLGVAQRGRTCHPRGALRLAHCVDASVGAGVWPMAIRDDIGKPGPWIFLASGPGWAAPGLPASAFGIRRSGVVAVETLVFDDGDLDGDLQGVRVANRAVAVDFLSRIDRHIAAGHMLCGWIGFEVGLALEGLQLGRRRRPHLPDAHFWVCEPAAIESVDLGPAAHASPLAAPRQWLDQRGDFVAAVDDLQRSIGAGDVYQANLTVELRLDGNLGQPGPALLQSISSAQPVPFASVLDAGDGSTLCCGSMERFLCIDGDEATSRPIKGTAARGFDADSDRALRDGLVASPKERAENLMIVDMVRHDLGRVAAPNRVDVTALLEPVGYRTLWHLESEIAATLRPGVALAQVLAATLPPASVTGAPKIAACRRIAALEHRRRGPYCGAIGVFLPNRHVRLAVGIRLAWQDEASIVIPVGAGIVADSVAEAEWRELLLKADGTLAWLGANAGDAITIRDATTGRQE